MNNKDILIRTIEQTDMHSVIKLLQSISEFKPLKTEYSSNWTSYSKQTNVHSVVAIIDKRIVGYGAIVVEAKIRGGKMGHVEDIVSHSKYRKKGIGKAILGALLDVAKANGCYKIALQCKEHNVKFYENCDYEISGVAMQMFLD